jgi:glyoxylase I family protein
MPDIASIHHGSFTVTDLDRSVAWYKEVLGLAELMREDHPDGSGYAIVLGKPDFSMCVGLYTHSANASGPCNETRTGLDHVSFGVAQRADLDTWAEHFKSSTCSNRQSTIRRGMRCSCSAIRTTSSSN